MPHHCLPEVAVRLLGQQQVAVLRRVPEIREPVLVVARGLRLGRVCIERPRLPDQVEADVAERHLLLKDRAVADPL